jgi:hypothetical protein
VKAPELRKAVRARNLALLVILLSWAVLMAVVTYVKLAGPA